MDRSIFSAHHKNAAGHEAGTQATMNWVTGKMDLICAARLKQADHSLGMKLRSNGIAKFIYGWNQHAMHAQVGTELNLCEVANGSLKSFPVSFQVGMKY